jgi:hypothetical protein
LETYKVNNANLQPTFSAFSGLEFGGKKWRPFIASVFHCGFNGGLVVIAGIAYALEPINHMTFQIMVGCFPALCIALKWYVLLTTTIVVAIRDRLSQ